MTTAGAAVSGVDDGYDGIIPDMPTGVGVGDPGIDYAGGEEGWKDVRLETGM